ncbi:MAG TPA: helix-turn-helix transcriptional regulator [Armatimonadota bacterium]|nr:helix-turn-helix transcriptional regulator [Armatimonadota bacterium]
MAETMGDRIRKARIKLKMKQEDAAGEADLSRVTWSHLENDEVDDPRLSTLQRVAHVLKMSLEALIGEKNLLPGRKCKGAFIDKVVEKRKLVS